MAKSIEKKRMVSPSNKTNKQKKCIASSSRLTRSKTNQSEVLLKSKSKIVVQKKSESKIEKKTEQRATRSLSRKHNSLEKEKEQNFGLPRITRSNTLKKNPPLNEVSISSTPAVKTENRIEKRHNFIKLSKIETNAVCLAKQKFSYPWPARIVKIEKKIRLWCIFLAIDARDTYK